MNQKNNKFKIILGIILILAIIICFFIVENCNNNKKYNHPTKDVLQRLKYANIQEDNILITKNQGTIWITSDGINIEIQTKKDINLDGTGQIGQMSIYDICSFFNAIEYIRLAS